MLHFLMAFWFMAAWSLSVQRPIEARQARSIIDIIMDKQLAGDEEEPEASDTAGADEPDSAEREMVVSADEEDGKGGEGVLEEEKEQEEEANEKEVGSNDSDSSDSETSEEAAEKKEEKKEEEEEEEDLEVVDDSLGEVGQVGQDEEPEPEEILDSMGDNGEQLGDTRLDTLHKNMTKRQLEDDEVMAREMQQSIIETDGPIPGGMASASSATSSSASSLQVSSGDTLARNFVTKERVEFLKKLVQEKPQA